MKKVNRWIDSHFRNIFLLFLYLQPFLDVLTAWGINYFQMNLTIGIIVRLLFLVFLFYCFLFLSHDQEKKKEGYYLGALLLYAIGFASLILIKKGTGAFLYEMQGSFRSFYFPIALLFMYSIQKGRNEKIDLRHYVRILMIYVFFILVPTFFHLGFDAYTQGKVGNLGWFHSTNEISAILSLFLPYFMLYLMDRKKTKTSLCLKILASGTLLYALFTLGTKMTIISLGLTLCFFGIHYLIELRKKKAYRQISIWLVLILTIAGTSVFLIPKTSFYQNIQIHLNYLGVTNPIQIVTSPKVLDHFVFSSRLSFLAQTNKNYRKAPLEEKMLGIGYIENYGTDEVNLKLIEMDFFDLFYRHGIVGFLLYMLPICLVLKTIFQSIKKQKKLSLEKKTFLLSLLLIGMMAFLVGHVLVAPSVSIFIIFLLLENSPKEEVSKKSRKVS